MMQRAISIAPNQPDVLSNLASYLVRMGEWRVMGKRCCGWAWKDFFPVWLKESGKNTGYFTQSGHPRGHKCGWIFSLCMCNLSLE